jgi:hypothetical protein
MPSQLSAPTMLAAPSSNESLEPGPTSNTITAANTNSRSGPTPHHHHHQHHHSRSSSARRSISATQGQLSSVPNGSTTSNTMPTPVPPKQGHAQPPGIPMGPGVPPFDGSRSPPGSKSEFGPLLKCNVAVIVPDN